MSKQYSIGEVAKITGIEGHTIRFWSTELSHKIKPTIGKGNRRYYTDSDITLLKEIKDLIHSKGYTIAMLKKGLPFETPHHTAMPENLTTSITYIQGKLSYLLHLYEQNL